MRFEDIVTPKVDKVQLVDRRGVEGNILGTLHLTTTHLIFKSEHANREIWVANNLIGHVERGALSVAGCPLFIRSKHFQLLHLLISRDKTCQDLLETLQRCARPVNVNELLAFEHRDLAEDSRGWSRFDWSIEFTRQGVDQHWAQSCLNQNYSLCDTYPSLLWLPSAASQHLLLASSKFRSKGRLPALSYFYKGSGASLCRCAQPLSGFSARCLEDERLMELIAETNEDGGELLLVDTRPMVNAMVNKVQGKGYEDEKNYTKMRFHFFDIENIHVMRSSQQKLVDGCTRSRDMTEWLRAVEGSGWLRHLRSILECSLFLAQALATGTSCVVHCSDGWDRTSQCVSLAQLLLDPFYRTVHGFQVLIEKDWLAFGHKFDDRCGHVGGLNDEAAKEVSPVFSQWLDAVWQVQRQFPRAFQFNERMLIHLHEHAYSCQFGTFIGNCEKDRKDLHLSKRTKSLWTWMDAHLEDYINAFYSPQLFSSLLSLDTRSSCISVFHSLYHRFDHGVLAREVVADSLAVTLEHIGVLESQVSTLQARVEALQTGLGRQPLSRQETAESGVFEASCTSSDEGGSTVRWQSLRDVEQCSNEMCGAGLTARVERRLHCHRCGRVYCTRCMNREKERVCILCRDESPSK